MDLIFVLDREIKKKFQDKKETLDTLENYRNDIILSLNNSNLSNSHKVTLESSKESIDKQIKDIKESTSYLLYISKSTPILYEYKKILNTPKKESFLGITKNKTNKKKRRLYKEFVKIAEKYINVPNSNPTKKPKIKLSNHIRCNNCKVKDMFDIIDKNTIVCTVCYSQQNILEHNSTFSDIDRINISSKYVYDRKSHFCESIKTYQAKQNCNIHEYVYNDLEEQFIKHHILIGDKNTPKEKRFSKLTKKHILLFLKELKYSSHYENVHLIHHRFTNVKPNEIPTSLENKLISDFDILLELYDKLFKDIKRKNFINTQYVLYQLLRKHRYDCKIEDFIILKTIDRKFFHDDICNKLFTELGWNFIPCW